MRCDAQAAWSVLSTRTSVICRPAAQAGARLAVTAGFPLAVGAQGSIATRLMLRAAAVLLGLVRVTPEDSYHLETSDGRPLDGVSTTSGGDTTGVHMMRYNCTTKGLGVRCLPVGPDGVYADSSCGGTSCALPPPPPRQWPPPPPPSPKLAPNILFILSDDL